jgi:hypothetical protein
MSHTAANDSASRRLDLDWVRIGAFGLLILYHVGMFYVPWGWHVKSPRILPWLQVPMLLVNPWRLSLLFLVSGAATRFMAEKMSAGRLAGLRLTRLLIPLLFGMLVIVPPQSYLQVKSAGYGGSFASFYGLYLRGYHGFCAGGDCLVLPTWNHLWFVAYLLVYTLLLAVVWGLARGAARAVQAGAERMLGGWGVIVWPALAFVALKLWVAPRFPETHALAGDWYVHAISAGPFLFGFLLAKSAGVWIAMVRLRWIALAGALASYGLFIGIAIASRLHVAMPPAIDTVQNVAYGLDQWSFIAAILGFARRHLAQRDGPARRYLTEAIFPFYIIHQTTIVVCACWLAKLNLPLALEAAILVAATAASCVITYEAARRSGWLRPLFGLKLQTAARRPRLVARGSEGLAAE